MTYCARCGKQITGRLIKDNRVSFHESCFERAEVEAIMDLEVKMMGQNKIRSELRNLSGLLDMVNHPKILRIVK